MKDLALVVKVDGSVQSSNLPDFQAQAASFLAGINTNLQTDQDFAEAKENVKVLKEVETRIANVKQDIVMQVADIAEIQTALDKIFDDYRNTRLLLNTTVKTEEQKRKQEIITTAEARFFRTVGRYEVSYVFKSAPDFAGAIKGKSSLVKMQEAVDALLRESEESLAEMIMLHAENTDLILAAETEFPGLFPDKKDLAIKQPEIVEAEITSRIAQHKLALKEKEERELAAKKAAREAQERLGEAMAAEVVTSKIPGNREIQEALAEVMADGLDAPAPLPVINDTLEPTATPVFSGMVQPDFEAPELSPPPPSFSPEAEYIITVVYRGTAAGAQDAADAIMSISGIVDTEVVKN
jgi:hypothetical protein